MALAAVPDTQTSIDEQVVEHDGLERALKARQSAKEEKAAVTKRYKERDDKVKALLDDVDELADDTVIRVGAFRISKRAVEARSVSFETSPSSRITISLLEG